MEEETHTFHLPVGEATITLQDVSLQLGLPIDGLPVSGMSSSTNITELCQELLGYTPSDQERQGNKISMSRLAEMYPELPLEATDVHIQRYTRAYILQLIGGSLFSGKSNNLVHVMYLPLLANFEETGKYSWGSACLAWLYREMCRATSSSAKEISGCLILLQLWIWDRFPYLAPKRRGIPRVDHAGPHAHLMAAPPLGYRWRECFNTVNTSTHALTQIRELVDKMSPDQVIWMPYSEDLIASLPKYCTNGRSIWTTISPLLCFSIVELHRPDRVLRQFGMRQPIPKPCDTRHDLHRIDLRGRWEINWLVRHSEFVQQWEDRGNRLAKGEKSLHGILGYHDPYMVWYRSITRRWHTMHVATVDYLIDTMAQIKSWSSSSDYITAMPHIQALSKKALQVMRAENRVSGHKHTELNVNEEQPNYIEVDLLEENRVSGHNKHTELNVHDEQADYIDLDLLEEEADSMSSDPRLITEEVTTSDNLHFQSHVQKERREEEQSRRYGVRRLDGDEGLADEADVVVFQRRRRSRNT
ncbi:hypothetical protein Scep_015169 [Stephania cephalantha]|uniref:Aminotransferase-like plant mobile domain-containing protein n=1 Tax=Stephania cephalantha TaxID=152367 RepID=A0AAP0P154_9MAGN